MSALPSPGRSRLPSPWPAVRAAVGTQDAARLLLAGAAVAAAVAWTVVALAGPLEIESIDPDLSRSLAYAVPGGLGLLLLLHRGPAPAWATGVVAWTATVGLGVLGLELTETEPLISFVPLGIAVLAVLVSAQPMASVAFVMIAAGFQFSIKAQFGIPLAPVGDALLAAAWFALLWGWATGSRPAPRRLPVALGILALYLGLSLISALLQDDLGQSFYSFRLSCWYMAAALLFALWADTHGMRTTVRRILLATIVLVGLYAAFRWIIGPGAAEEAAVRTGGPYVLDDLDNVRLFGSMPGPTALAVWCALAGPVCLAFVLAPLPVLERLGGLVGLVLTAAVIGPTEIRSGLVAMVLGMAVVLVAFGAAPAFRGHRALPLGLALALAIPAGVVFVTVQLAEGGSRAERLKGLLDPLNDRSVQDRLVKWETVLSDVRGKPFGNGLGASGGAEARYARFTTSATYNPDSGYVKTIYDQGYAVAFIFVAALIALLVALMRQAIRAGPPGDAAIAVAAAGSLASFGLVLHAGAYQEGMANLLLWIMCGLALAPVATREREVTP